MSKHAKKMIAPIIVTVLMIAYYALYFGYISYIIDITALKILFGVFPLVFGAVMIGVCIHI
ncbi:hypothetical protein [Butyrivibrio sp. MC2013]|uniref:hypothetical protein n=1 Tax=Butyrivibrio sp. MC2013 TaxID=1280686 RepID=UPI00041A8A28|nr:hypothetical protein [Butyrivibrio sp. MC2013]